MGLTNSTHIKRGKCRTGVGLALAILLAAVAPEPTHANCPYTTALQVASAHAQRAILEGRALIRAAREARPFTEPAFPPAPLRPEPVALVFLPYEAPHLPTLWARIFHRNPETLLQFGVRKVSARAPQLTAAAIEQATSALGLPPLPVRNAPMQAEYVLAPIKNLIQPLVDRAFNLSDRLLAGHGRRTTDAVRTTPPRLLHMSLYVAIVWLPLFAGTDALKDHNKGEAEVNNLPKAPEFAAIDAKLKRDEISRAEARALLEAMREKHATLIEAIAYLQENPQDRFRPNGIRDAAKLLLEMLERNPPGPLISQIPASRRATLSDAAKLQGALEVGIWSALDLVPETAMMVLEDWNEVLPSGIPRPTKPLTPRQKEELVVAAFADLATIGYRRRFFEEWKMNPTPEQTKKYPEIVEYFTSGDGGRIVEYARKNELTPEEASLRCVQWDAWRVRLAQYRILGLEMTDSDYDALREAALSKILVPTAPSKK